MSKLLATCVSIGSLTAVTIRRISTRCQGDDVLAPIVKVPFHDSLYCWGRHAFKIPARGKSISRLQQWNYLIVGNNLRECLNSGEKVKSQPSWDGRLFRKDKLNTCIIYPNMVSTVNLLLRNYTAQVSFVSFNLSWILGARGWGGWGVLFGIIKQMWHPCGVANMVVYPSWALSPSGYALGWQCSLGVDNHVSNPAGMSYLYIVNKTSQR